MGLTTFQYGPLEYDIGPVGTAQFLFLDIEVLKGDSLNVFLVDAVNQNNFVEGKQFEHRGPGKVRRFIGALKVPSPGNWSLIVENHADKPVIVKWGYEMA